MPENLSRQRRWQLRKKAAGLCSQCGEMAVPGKSRCAPCSKVMKASYKQRAGKCQKEGTCIRCDQPALPGILRCEEHRKYQIDYYRKYIKKPQ